MHDFALNRIRILKTGREWTGIWPCQFWKTPSILKNDCKHKRK